MRLERLELAIALSDPDEALALAAKHCDAGNYPAALPLYTAILRAFPDPEEEASSQQNPVRLDRARESINCM